MITGDFLGDESTWFNAGLGLRDVHGLWGGRNIFVAGDGRVIVQSVNRAQFEKRYAFMLDTDALRELFRACIRHDILAVTFPQRPAIPDEAFSEIRLMNARGETRAVGKLAKDKSERFAAIYRALFQIETRTRALRPIYQGAFDPAFQFI